MNATTHPRAHWLAMGDLEVAFDAAKSLPPAEKLKAKIEAVTACAKAITAPQKPTQGTFARYVKPSATAINTTTGLFGPDTKTLKK